jgi:7tm Chemosensory receptor
VTQICHTFYQYQETYSFQTRTVVVCTAVAMVVYPISALMLFCVVANAITFNYQTLRQQIEQLDRDTDLRPDELDSYLRRWQHIYSITNKAAQSLNSAFELVFLNMISCAFIGVIMQSIYLFLSAMEQHPRQTFISIFFLTTYLFHLWLFGFVADQMRIEVSGTMKM